MNLPPVGAPDSDPAKDADAPDDAAVVPTGVDRKTLDAVFGQVLPDVTGDERDHSENAGFDASWYQDNRPPHHDR